MKKLFVFIILMSVFLLPGCKKYPDGPLISFDSAKHRITGDWTLQNFYINGIDSTAMVIPYECAMKMSFGINGDYLVLNQYSCRSGVWGLKNNNRYLLFGSAENPCNCKIFGPYTSNLGLYWKIRRLTHHEMWLTINFDGKDYEVDFKK